MILIKIFLQKDRANLNGYGYVFGHSEHFFPVLKFELFPSYVSFHVSLELSLNHGQLRT